MWDTKEKQRNAVCLSRKHVIKLFHSHCGTVEERINSNLFRKFPKEIHCYPFWLLSKHICGSICGHHFYCYKMEKELSQYLYKRLYSLHRFVIFIYLPVCLAPWLVATVANIFLRCKLVSCKFQHLIHNNIYYLTNGHVKAIMWMKSVRPRLPPFVCIW